MPNNAKQMNCSVIKVRPVHKLKDKLANISYAEISSSVRVLLDVKSMFFEIVRHDSFPLE